MARLSMTVKRPGNAKARKASRAKGKTAKAKRHISPTIIRRKGRSIADLTEKLNEAREQQTATAEILKAINSSPGNLTPVFDVILEKAHSLCDVPCGSLQLYDGDYLRAVAVRGMTEPFEMFLRQGYRITDRIRRNIDSGHPVQTADFADVLTQSPDDSVLRAAVELGGIRTMLSVPLLRDGLAFGRIVAARQEVRPFTDKQIGLLQGFADQAVIAIENARLFDEVQAKTRDLTESLRQQTATADVLKTISRSAFDLQAVFDTLTTSAVDLLGMQSGTICVRDGEVFRYTSAAGAFWTEELWRYLQEHPVTPGRNTAAGRVILSGCIEQIPDVLDDPEYAIPMQALTPGNSPRAFLGVPLLGKNRVEGAIVLSRQEPGQFTQREVDILQTFADQASIAIENTRLFNETQEALAHQTASAEVLQVIGKSMADAQPVFERIVDSIERLLPHKQVGIFLAPGDGLLHAAALRGLKMDQVHSVYPLPVEQSGAHAVLEGGRQRYFADIMNGVDVPPSLRRVGQIAGNSANVITPMLWEGRAIGTIAVSREPNAPFSETELSLLKTFADQAVIAIENARLFNEVQARTRDLSESLQQQTATADVLKVISRSAFDLQAVFDTLLASAVALSGASGGTICVRDGDVFPYRATNGASPDFAKFLSEHPATAGRHSTAGRVLLMGEIVAISDIREDSEYTVPLVRENGDYESLASLGVPLLRNGTTDGALVLVRREPGLFGERQIELVKTFADQAVIAIENTRLFEEVQAKTRDLTEALVHQTGSANILRVIASSPTEVEPVLKAIVESACELCEAYDAVLRLKQGDVLKLGAHHGTIPADWNLSQINPHWTAGRAALERKPVHVHDMSSSEGDGFPEAQARARIQGHRTILSVPLLQEGKSIGTITLRRLEVNPFSDKQIALLQTFADQAVIAIGNVRLFEEVQSRTLELTESLRQQTATSQVLKVISSSPGELKPVFNSMLENAVQICDAKFGNLFLVDGDTARWEAGVGTPPKLVQYFTQSKSFRPTPGGHLDRVMRTRQVSHSADDTAESVVGAAARLGAARSTVCVPMVKDDDLVGAIFIYRTEVRPFTDKQIDFVRNFAAQAVIAIENARLLKELRQRTDDLTKSLDDLRTAQDRLIQTEKLASLGQLTAGIAHEIKNPLNFVNNFAALSIELTDELKDILRQAELAEKLQTEVNELTGLLKSNLEKVVQHGKRADSIVKNMLLHSREGSGELRVADINGLVEESLNLAYHGARAENSGFNISLQRQFDASAGSAELFPQEITRALLNLISNGFYAATKRKTENGESSFEPTLSAATRNLGASVEIRIRDNGTGIPPELKEKIFNPFFTTKPAGEGTGLGLSMTHDIIVKQHGGTIRVDSEPGVSTEFIVTLPRAAAVQNSQRGTR